MNMSFQRTGNVSHTVRREHRELELQGIHRHQLVHHSGLRRELVHLELRHPQAPQDVQLWPPEPQECLRHVHQLRWVLLVRGPRSVLRSDPIEAHPVRRQSNQPEVRSERKQKKAVISFKSKIKVINFNEIIEGYLRSGAF